jgi:plastocyanin
VDLPKVVFALPLIALGVWLPGRGQPVSLAGHDTVVGMTQEEFDRQSVTITQDQSLELVNNSNFLHVVAPGVKARVDPDPAVPSFGPDEVRSLPRGAPFVTEPWEQPGTYHLTCTLHPEMNLTVVVVQPH